MFYNFFPFTTKFTKNEKICIFFLRKKQLTFILFLHLLYENNKNILIIIDKKIFSSLFFSFLIIFKEIPYLLLSQN